MPPVPRRPWAALAWGQRRVGAGRAVAGAWGRWRGGRVLAPGPTPAGRRPRCPPCGCRPSHGSGAASGGGGGGVARRRRAERQGAGAGGGRGHVGAEPGTGADRPQRQLGLRRVSVPGGGGSPPAFGLKFHLRGKETCPAEAAVVISKIAFEFPIH